MTMLMKQFYFLTNLQSALLDLLSKLEIGIAESIATKMTLAIVQCVWITIFRSLYKILLKLSIN